MFTIDDVSFDVDVLCDEFTESFSVLTGENSGRTQDGNMYIDVIGTFYNYTLHLKKRAKCSVADYDKLWDMVAQPVKYHKVKFPHNQTEWEFNAYISDGERKLKRRENGKNLWGDITLTFVPMKPQRR